MIYELNGVIKKKEEPKGKSVKIRITVVNLECIDRGKLLILRIGKREPVRILYSELEKILVAEGFKTR